MPSISDFEIMAPVGSRESLAAAIQAGADSVYFGIENLNMRARSANTFTITMQPFSLTAQRVLFAVCAAMLTLLLQKVQSCRLLKFRTHLKCLPI